MRRARSLTGGCMIATLALFVRQHGAAPSSESSPHVWIFVGLPGDRPHEKLYRSCAGRLKQVLTTRFTVEPTSCRVISEAAAPGALTREKLREEFSRIVERTRDATPVWIFVLGHANPTRSGANFNLPGPDISAPEFGTLLAGARKGAPVAVFFTTSTSGPFLKHLAAPGRVVVTATTAQGQINETEFPHALVEFLRQAPYDAGGLSIREIFSAVKQRVASRFKRQGLLQTEHALLDGNGDGIGTEEPREADAAGADRFRLHFRETQKTGEKAQPRDRI